MNRACHRLPCPLHRGKRQSPASSSMQEVARWATSRSHNPAQRLVLAWTWLDSCHAILQSERHKTSAYTFEIHILFPCSCLYHAWLSQELSGLYHDNSNSIAKSIGNTITTSWRRAARSRLTSSRRSRIELAWFWSRSSILRCSAVDGALCPACRAAESTSLVKLFLCLSGVKEQTNMCSGYSALASMWILEELKSRVLILGEPRSTMLVYMHVSWACHLHIPDHAHSNAWAMVAWHNLPTDTAWA